jgi:nucleoside-diphosphate-sugar epimerase
MKRHCSIRVLILRTLLLCCCFSVQAAVATVTSNAAVDDETTQLPRDFLTRDSVVLITGAAGALALHRTFGPRKILCIDHMADDTSNSGNENADDQLSLLEFKRQRAFRLFQELGSTLHFYRVDMRPSVPEFFEAGQVPVLNHIFNAHADITHVVHLAASSSPQRQAIPRVHGESKAGLMESMLEQLRVVQRQRKNNNQTVLPHFTYASTDEVYQLRTNAKTPNPPPFQEALPLTTPSSLRGATHLIDELLVQTYYKTDKIFSAGLRFFTVYGPWASPGSDVFELAEERIRRLGQTDALPEDRTALDDVHDYVYIDDAVDAIMAAMQFRPKEGNPVVFNVGSGQGTSLRAVQALLQAAATGVAVDPTFSSNNNSSLTSIADTGRSQRVLGFKARVPLQQGLEQVLAWHYDRAFPYGTLDEARQTAPIAEKGMIRCNKYDTECLLGAPVFPCASECAHESQCITSFYDDVLVYTRMLTEDCEAVMYTVAIEEDLDMIPSAKVQVSASSKSSVDGAQCNIAFVSEESPLFRRLLLSEETSSVDGNKPLLHGHWVLVPVTISKHVSDRLHILKLVPKLSPGLFFAGKTRRAIYCDPDVVFDNVPKLLEEFSVKIPPIGAVAGKAATAMLIGKSRGFAVNGNSVRERVRNTAYRMIRIAAIDEMATGDAFSLRVDSSFMIHALASDDSRLFRCDIFGEIVQWDVSEDSQSIEFIVGLHDMWSRVLAKKRDAQPWWTGGNVEPKAVPTVARDKKDDASQEDRRRLQAVDDATEEEEEAQSEFLGKSQDTAGFAMPGAIQDAVRAVFGAAVKNAAEDDDEAVDEHDADESVQHDSPRTGYHHENDSDDAGQMGAIHLKEYYKEQQAL